MPPPMHQCLLKLPSAINYHNCTSDLGLRIETRLMLRMSGMHLTQKREAAICFIEEE